MASTLLKRLPELVEGGACSDANPIIRAQPKIHNHFRRLNAA
jgi:hypothetical protein